MQNIIIEKPYRFIPPERSTFWSSFIQTFNLHAWYLRRKEGVVDCEIRGVEHLRGSLDAGHGVMITPNHCRYADPMIMGWLGKRLRCHFYAMASWHLFQQSSLMSWAIRKMGGFSVYREGVDRQAIDSAIEILVSGSRPLIIFPEGAVSRTNDRLHAMLDGVAFIARAAAKKRAKRDPDHKVVVHPVAIKYLFQGDIESAVAPVLREIEERFTWRPNDSAPLMSRIANIGRALLCLKELAAFGETQDGELADRLHNLTDRLLHPIEEEWFGEKRAGPVVPRVKNLRMQLLPDMVKQRVDERERERRWEQLADMYLAQQVTCYPADYLVELPSVDRILETVERFEEDLSERVRVHGELKAVIDVGEAIEVAPKRDRSAKVDPVMAHIEGTLSTKLRALAGESRLWSE